LQLQFLGPDSMMSRVEARFADPVFMGCRHLKDPTVLMA